MLETDEQIIARVSEELAIVYMRNMSFKDTPEIFTRNFLDIKNKIAETLRKNYK
jgi:hypothetical protein